MRFKTDPRLFVAVILGIVLLPVAAFAETSILITNEYPDENNSNVTRHRRGGLNGENFISGGPTLDEPQTIRFGPDGNLYVLTEDGSGSGYAVYRYNGMSGVYMDTFIASGTGGLDEAKDMVFGPDGDLYITANDPNDSDVDGRVLEFNGATGAFNSVFVAAGAGPPDPNNVLAEAGAIVFGPDGNLYVGNANSANHNVLRFNGTTGAFMDMFIPPQDPNTVGLQDINYMTFGPDGNLYISNENSGPNDSAILRFNGTTGAFMDVFIPGGTGGLDEPFGLLFDEESGNLFVVGGSSDNGIFRFDGTTGAFIDFFTPPGNSNMNDARGAVFYLTTEVPTLDLWAMILLGVVIAISGGLVLRRAFA